MATLKYMIVRDRVEIYKDFAINLLNYIYSYYIDKETLSNDTDIKNHFNWCFNKTCDEFIEENINFKDNNELRKYYYAYYYHQFYKIPEINKLVFYENFWRNIFEIDLQKNKNTLNLLLEIYIIYDKSINNEKNILEIV
jgi:hypothetical protein